jgi:hypothetical protein
MKQNFSIFTLTGILLFSLSVFADTSAPSIVVPSLQTFESGRYLQINSGYGMFSSALTGAGFNADIPGKFDFIYGLSFSFQSPDSGTRFLLDYDKTSNEQNAPSGLSPSSITLTREEFKFLVSVTPWQENRLQNLRLGLGYGLLKSGATDTLPNNVLSNQVSQGLHLFANYKMNYKPQWNLILEGGLYLPHQIKESSQVTGNNPKYLGLEASAQADYSWLQNFIIFFGANYRIDQVSYDGTASRGVTSGKDTRTLFTIPVGIKISY